MAEPVLDKARSVLDRNRNAALKFIDLKGRNELMQLLVKAQDELQRRMIELVGKSGADTFSYAQMRATLVQIKIVTAEIEAAMYSGLVNQSMDAAGRAAANTARYLTMANGAFGEVGLEPLDINTPRMLSRAVNGAKSSLLRRFGTDPNDPRRPGILDRYGMTTVGFFETRLQLGFLQKKRFEQIQQDLIESSPFLKEKPRHWAERIFRTEGMSAYNKGSHESYLSTAEGREDEFVKIVVAFFDDRTAADSYATHGQIRRLEEPFDTWYGPIMHPPDRPNDRGSMVLHRKRWPLPKSLQWKSDEQILAAWRKDGRKGKPPPRPLMTTVPLSEIGQ